MIRTSGLVLQTLSVYMYTVMKHCMHGLNLVPGTIHAKGRTYQVSLLWNFIFSAYNMYLTTESISIYYN